MTDLGRRDMLHGLLGVALGHAMLGLLAPRGVLAGPVAQPLSAWLARLDKRCRDLRVRALAQADWQQEIEALLSQVSLEDLLAAIDFERLELALSYPDLGVDTTPARFPGLVPEDHRLAFYPKLFGLAPGRAIIPHGHRHMASAHLVLGGGFHLRQYDRVAADGTHWTVRPVVDQVIGPGHASSISDEARNVHWLIAGRERAWTLDVIVSGLTPGARPFEIQNLDPDRAEPAGDGLLRMPTLDVNTALRRYGKT